jgi:hypothetical protein
VIAEIRISSDEILLTSGRFEFYVRKSLFNDKTIESTDEFPVLTQLMSETNKMIEQVNQIEKQVPENVVSRIDAMETGKANKNDTDRGILESALINAFLTTEVKYQGSILDNLNGTVLEATLSNSYKYPSTNSTQTITLPKRLNNLDYKLSYEIKSSIGGYVDNVQFFDKALNAFKVKYFGSATKVVLKIYVVGGIY